MICQWNTSLISQINLRGVSIDLKLNNRGLSENLKLKTLPTRPLSHRYILIYILAMESVKMRRFKTFWVGIFVQETCCCLDVSIDMSKCVFCRDIVLEISLKRCVYLSTNSNSSRWRLSRFVVQNIFRGNFGTKNLVSPSIFQHTC